MLRIEEDKREEWEAMLVAPLPGRETRQAQTPAVVEAEGAAFMALMMKQEGGPGGAER